VRVFVTGGAGFIGSHFVRTALETGYDGLGEAEITVYDSLSYSGNLANLAGVIEHPRYRFVQGDIRDVGQLADVLPGHDLVVNFAAESHVDRSITGAHEFVTTNVVGVQTLLDASRSCGVERVLHVSTDEVYGSIPSGAFRETDLLRPSSPYSASKAGGDLIAHAYSVTYGMDIVITRCTNNYGPYQFPEKVIPLFVTNLLDGKRVPLYGDGLNSRDWLHVDDHCRGIALALTDGVAGEIYNIGGGTELTNKQLTEIILDACDKDWSSVEMVADRLGHDRRYAIDDSKIRESLGYRPQVDFATGIADTLAWYRDNETWWRAVKASAASTA
jgi:dTDP-glucose 4,6-dehydratase